MRKNICKTTFICLVLVGSLTGCTQTKVMKECKTFEEMADPTKDTLSDWSQVALGLHASMASIDIRYPRSVKPEIADKNSCELTGWKGEKLSAQLLLWAAEDINQIECEFKDFSSSSDKLPSTIAQARFVRYVMTDIFEPGCGYRKPEDFPASLVPDMLDNIDCFNIKAKTVRPVWITVSIPETAKAGTYKSKLTLTARDQKKQEFEIVLNVQGKVLPPPSQWVYHLDLWQHPSSVARVYNLKVWSDEHFEAVKPLMVMLANAGQKVITATLNKDPWNVQTYDKYEDMILWTRNADGTWTYDYTIFDKWVSFMMDLGIKGMINCYSIVPWNNELHYKDNAKNKMVTIKADPGTQVFKDMWTPFLKDFVKHMQSKGWLGITNIAMDERNPKEMIATLDLLKDVAPELGISFADNQATYKKYPYIKDMSVSAHAKVDLEDINYRKEKGYNTTFYVCCSDKFPNMFTCSEPAEAVYAAWYATAAGYDGFLRWAYNSWVENPLTDSRFRTWPAGDTYIVYPEARSSIRFERLIEGIQDVEKLRILRNDLKQENTPESLIKLELLDNELAKFNTIHPTGSFVDMLNRAKGIINKISE